ncbi:MAG: hypothetical protein QOG89_3692, partial [Thermomicrobiales bacterium]|nr:hypothetical protein [Thermomicrobiales bacterium]
GDPDCCNRNCSSALQQCRCNDGSDPVNGQCLAGANETCTENAECLSGACTCQPPNRPPDPQAGHCQAPFYQGFETNTSGWTGVTRVASGTHGITSSEGDYHGEVGTGSFAAVTRWGGYSNQFPPGGYTTSLDIYLDTTGNYANDTRFDWISAVNRPDCDHQRDFAFVAGYYEDTDATGTGPRFVINAQFNSGRGSSFPKDASKMPITIVAPGWYTFQHEFRGAPGGPLVVEMTILNSLGVPVMSWTLSDPSDIIGVTVGGNRYGGVTNEFPFLAIDESRRTEP